MKGEFSARYVRAAKVYGDSPSEDRIVNEYASYLSGEYAVCLRFLSPETIFLKEFAMAKIQELLATPDPSDADWSAALRNWVTRLDGMEREFAPCDTARFGSLPSRVRYIKNARESSHSVSYRPHRRSQRRIFEQEVTEITEIQNLGCDELSATATGR